MKKAKKVNLSSIFWAIMASCFIFATSTFGNDDVINNIALKSMGATATDNGSFNDYGTDQDAELTIDDDDSTYWAGLQSISPQKMSIQFDQAYTVDKVVIIERSDAYMLSGSIEYHDGTEWKFLTDINKNTFNYSKSFQPLKATGIRISVDKLTAPSGWYNKVACIKTVKVNSVSDNTCGDFNAGYQAGIDFCKNNPSACGISTGENTQCPPTGSTTINPDLSFSLPTATYYNPFGSGMDMELDFKFLGEQSGKLLWELESYKVK